MWNSFVVLGLAFVLAVGRADASVDPVMELRGALAAAEAASQRDDADPAALYAMIGQVMGDPQFSALSETERL
ncbi:MAG TPA: hypothetical protein VGF56_15715 [Rhizomicrobium sp.]|jgi:hypothetical protein